MIISASRRTDIPACYADWFFRRLEEAYVCVANPFNPRSISRISLETDVVDAIVFWTKNPIPMLPRLGALSAYPCLYQFTLTPYGRDLETGLPDKETQLLPAFRALAKAVGPERVVWRYDPILFTDVYTPAWHLSAFSHYAAELSGCTQRVIISFVDLYVKTRKNLQATALTQPAPEELISFASSLRACAQQHGMTMQTCAEEIDLAAVGIPHGACIDQALLERIIGAPLQIPRHSGQRSACLCAESIDIGAYDTCTNGCRYCYANTSAASIAAHGRIYDPDSPILCRTITPEDIVRERRCVSLRKDQYTFF